MSRLHAIRTAAVVATLLVPLAAIVLDASAATAGPPVCTTNVADDFNGDGHSDIVVTQPNTDQADDPTESAVRVLYGSSTGLTKVNNLYLDGTGLTGFTPVPGDNFGIATAIGDFNGDGCADLAVDAVSSSVVNGGDTVLTNAYVIVYYGSLTGLNSTASPAPTVIPEAQIVPASQNTTSFIESAAAGNFNGDAYDDLVVGVPDSNRSVESTDVGGFAVLYGSATGLGTSGEQWFTQASPGVVGSAEVFDEFGMIVAVGDFNGDGRSDIAVAAPDQTVSGMSFAGTVTVLYDSASGITATGSQQWTQNTAGVPGTAENGDEFGDALAAGYVTSTTHADLIIGTPNEGIGNLANAGTITLLKGSTAATGITAAGSQLWDQNSTGVPGVSQKGDLFGYSVSIGDLNGDSHGDVAIGVPGEAIGSVKLAGEVNVLYGTSGGLTGTGSQGWSQNTTGIVGTSETDDSMGVAVQATNLTGSAHADLVATVPFEDSSSRTDNGLLNVILGSTGKTGLTSTGNTDIDATGLVNGPISFGEFGIALANVSAADDHL